MLKCCIVPLERLNSQRPVKVYDVNSLADFWSWLRLGFLPLLVQHSWAWSEGWGETRTSMEMGLQDSARLGCPLC